MKLYFAPLACSLAVRIALYESGVDAEYIHVDTKAKRTEDGTDFRTIHPVGMVPVLEIENGKTLTEVAAILQYVCEVYPQANLAPTDVLGRARLQQWLSYIGMELQKAVYTPVLDPQASAATKEYALSKAPARLAWAAMGLVGQEYLLGRYTVADAFLFSILNWSSACPVDLKPWPIFHTFMKRMLARPHVRRAFDEELALYQATHPQPAAAGAR